MRDLQNSCEKVLIVKIGFFLFQALDKKTGSVFENIVFFLDTHGKLVTKLRLPVVSLLLFLSQNGTIKRPILFGRDSIASFSKQLE